MNNPGKGFELLSAFYCALMYQVLNLLWMRDFLIGILIFLLLPSLYVDTVVYVAFKLQQDYIVQNKCLEKDEVVNTCNGGCVLTDQLKEANKNQENSKYPGNQDTKLFPVFIHANNKSASVLFSINSEGILHKASIIPRAKWCDIFHPPQV